MRWLGLALVLACAPAVAPEPTPSPPPEPAVVAAAGPGDMSEGSVKPVPEDISSPAPAPGDGEALARETASVKPGINAPYKTAGAARRWARRFERDGREVHDRRHEILRALGLTRGMAIADVGAGTGLFTLAFAEAVGPEGTVYAVDVVPGFLDHVRARVEKAGFAGRVRLVQASDRSSELPPGSVDAIFMSDAYHHLEYPQHTLASLRAALRPGGVLWLIDFRREADSDEWLKQHVRAGQAEVLRELALAGFVPLEELSLLRENYFIKLKVRGS
ncbi:MAG: class I SAM-dependent methyltransferase [Myxococcales bacterium]|nr:class I SAM-dependent methyltransferase [Myxococcales bacterium]